LGSGLSVGGSIEVAVRVRLRVRGRNDKYVELVVLASGGAESPRPLTALDPETAAKICFKGSEGAERYEVIETSSTKEASLYPQTVVLELLDDEGSVLSSVTADLVVEEGLVEPLITDVTIDALGIEVISLARGSGDMQGIPLK
jgi:hypothetical protein